MHHNATPVSHNKYILKVDMKKTRRLKLPISETVFDKLQELKSKNGNMSKFVINSLINTRARDNYYLSASPLTRHIYLRLTEEEYNTIKSKHNSYIINGILEYKLGILNKAERQKVKRQEDKRKIEFDKMLNFLEQIKK